MKKIRNQIREKALKKDEEKRKEMEFNKFQEERIKKDLTELDNRFKSENPSIKKAAKQLSYESPSNPIMNSHVVSLGKPGTFEKMENVGQDNIEKNENESQELVSESFRKKAEIPEEKALFRVFFLQIFIKDYFNVF